MVPLNNKGRESLKWGELGKGVRGWGADAGQARGLCAAVLLERITFTREWGFNRKSPWPICVSQPCVAARAPDSYPAVL